MNREEFPAEMSAEEYAKMLRRQDVERRRSHELHFNVSDPEPGVKYFVAVKDREGMTHPGDVSSMEAKGWRRSEKKLPPAFATGFVLMERDAE